MSTTSYGPENGQFGRMASLIVSKGSQALDISDQRFRFEVRASDIDTPNNATIRVYNLSEQTANRIIAEFDTVILSAGYQFGNFGIIFQGDVKQFRRGRERNVDNYLDILAADGDEAYNFGVVRTTMPAGTTPVQELSTYADAMGIPVSQETQDFLLTGGINPAPRGKVAWGMARDYVRDLANDHNARWSIQNGELTLVPVTSYLPGDVVAINTASGMIGLPEQTDQGITIRCYLNPLIKIGRAVMINQADINKVLIKEQGFPNRTSLSYPATVSNDGLYRVLVAEHVGDLRGNEFYTELTCLSIDKSSPSSTSILSNG